MIVALTMSVLGLSAPAASAADATVTDPVLETIDSVLRSEYTSPGTYSFIVPQHVSRVTFDVYGGQGGGLMTEDTWEELYKGGPGGRATATFAATPGQVFQVDVGAKGEGGLYSGMGHGGAGGANGDSSGGQGGLPYAGGGGGASDVRTGSCAAALECGLADRILVAGGGGGTSLGPVINFYHDRPDAIGGAGGGAVGSDGSKGANGDGLWPGGGGGAGSGGNSLTSGVGGAGGAGGGGGASGTAGTPGFITSSSTGGTGGNAGEGAFFGDPGTGGGGGGGGYFGGGGGGGGGGSDFASARGGGGAGAGGSGYIGSGASNWSSENGVQEGDGKVVISWIVDPTISVPHSDAVTVGQNLTASVSLSYAYNPTGTVTFKVFHSTDTSCSSPLATLSGTVSGGRATSGAYTPTSAGTYAWTASYGGDANNNAVGPTACGASGSTVVVRRATPTIVSQSGPSWPTTRASFWDNATLSGGYELTGSVTFALYDNATCSGNPLLTAGPDTVNEYGRSGVVLFPPAAGTFYWVATYSGDSNNESVASGCGADQVIVHEQVTPTFTFDLSSLSRSYGDAAFSVASAPYVSTNSTGTLSFALGAGSVGCAVTPEGTVSLTAAATGDARCVVKASIAADPNYLSAGPISQAFSIAKAMPGFTNVAIDSSTYDGEQHGATADVSGVGGEGLGEASVSYELRSGAAPDYTYGTPTTNAPTNAGTYRVTFGYAGSSNYTSASDNSHVLTVGKLNQSITFAALPDRTYGDAAFTVNAIADSGLAVVFAVGGQCGLSGTTVHLQGAGSCTVLATQPGDANYNAARSVSQTFSIAKANPTISVTGYSVAYDGAIHAAIGTATGVLDQPLGGLDLAATRHSNAGSYSDGWTFTDTTGNYNNASGTVVDGIARATLTITPTSGQKMVYGSTPPDALTYGLSGLVNGETESVLRVAGALSGQASCSAAGVSDTSPAGNYPISCTTGSLAATNYTFASSTQTVTFAITRAKLTVAAEDKSVQYSDPATLGYTITGFVNGETLATSDVTGAASLGTTATLTEGKVTSAPGTYSITAARGSLASANYEFAFVNGTLTVGQEDARSTYTGNSLFWGPSASSTSATVTLTATIKDISAVSGDPAYDAHPGTISHATVAFVNRETKATLCTASVALVTSSEPTTGTTSCTTTLGISSSGATQYTIGIVVSGRYTDNASSEDTVVDVAAPIGSYFITGGGFLAESASAGQYAADAGAKSNFGFNVKSKGVSNLQGNVNVIFRRAGRTYQIKGNSLTSLGESPSPCTKPTAASPCMANFVSKANLQDITNPNAPISLGGNLTFQMSMTDCGTPTKDSIGITLYNGSTLLFSSNWSGTRTVEQPLGGGNLAVR